MGRSVEENDGDKTLVNHSPLRVLQKQMSTRAFTSFATLYASKWVNRPDFQGDPRVLWASRAIFALYVALSSALMAQQRASLRAAAASLAYNR
jgi:hypothetical protein